MTAKRTILVADDDPHIREVICFALTQAGYRTVEAADGAAALAQFDAEQPALLILDILMPELDGTEVCRRLRRKSIVPIVFLSSKDEEIDRILGLELGGDDYLTKPFSPRELVARVNAVLRRITPEQLAVGGLPATQTPAATTLEHGRLRLDLEAYKAYWDTTEVVLTVTEFGIVRTLLQRPGRVFKRDGLMDGAYGLDRIVSDRTIDSHVRRVRAKFAAAGGDPIATVHGLGYQLADC